MEKYKIIIKILVKFKDNKKASERFRQIGNQCFMKGL